jgi:hypothetical protein
MMVLHDPQETKKDDDCELMEIDDEETSPMKPAGLIENNF